MIVACPACHTRYRHSDDSGAGATAKCSQCSETFPLVAMRRGYALLPVPPTQVPVMAAAGAHDLGDRVPEIPPPADWPSAGPQEAPSAGSDWDATGPSAADIDELTGEPLSGSELEQAARTQHEDHEAAAPAETGETRGSSSSILAEIAVLLVPAALGAGLAYYLAGVQQADPVTWSALGAAAGFVIGWGGLLWMRRKD